MTAAQSRPSNSMACVSERLQSMRTAWQTVCQVVFLRWFSQIVSFGLLRGQS